MRRLYNNDDDYFCGIFGTVGGYILLMKLLTSKRGKQAVKDYTKEFTDLTYDILKENMKDTKKWTELMMEGVED